MNLDRFAINRRSFIKAATPFALGLFETVRCQIPIERGRFNDEHIPLVRDQLLKLVNEERARAGLSRLRLDELACKVASEHARDMAAGQFLSHWGSDGRKPYHRYSFAGGTDAVQENVSSGDNIPSVTLTAVGNTLAQMHASMLNEAPPNDGHRRTVLFQYHTHVGFGIALSNNDLRLDELYVARYVAIDPLARKAKPKSSLMINGRVLNPRHELTGADVYYEPLPSPPSTDWLREPRSYGMPAAHDRLLPRLPDRTFYSDGSTGTIEVSSDGRFRIPVSLFKKPGINTVVIWIGIGANGTPFPAAQICIRGE